MEALEWDASLKVGSREITDIHKWQGLKKQLRVCNQEEKSALLMRHRRYREAQPFVTQAR